MSETKTISRGGTGFLSLLTILFIGLKLTGYINWSWWWVLSPLWIGWSIGLLIILGLIIIAAISNSNG